MYATRPRLKADDPELRPDPSLARSREQLEAYRPPNAEQARMRDRILAFLETYPRDAHLRSRLEGHLTASALVVDADFDRVLLLHHRKLHRWLQPGGHCDGDGNLVGVAFREASEESGISGLEIVPRIIDLDIHEIPERRGVPRHLHLDTRFLVVAPEGAEPAGNHESNALAFHTFDQARRLDVDDSVLRLLDGL